MRYPLLAAALLALTVTACDGKKEEATTPAPAIDPVAAPAEQSPAPEADAPAVMEQQPGSDATLGAVPAETPPPAAEEQPAPAAQTK
jgi:DNA polymerase-3 subunit gamma/tau